MDANAPTSPTISPVTVAASAFMANGGGGPGAGPFGALASLTGAADSNCSPVGGHGAGNGLGPNGGHGHHHHNAAAFSPLFPYIYSPAAAAAAAASFYGQSLYAAANVAAAAVGTRPPFERERYS